MATVDISDPVADLCAALGVERTNVLRLNLTPTKASAWVAKENENGAKYVDPSTNEIAVDVLDFEVKT